MTRVASDDAVGTATPSSEGTKSKALDLIRRSISRLGKCMHGYIHSRLLTVESLIKEPP